ncbi:universal stress protein [bacterium]|nr:universal stress protein [bacterium]
MKVEGILFPTDFSENSMVALDHAIFWAQAYRATLCLMHAINKQIWYDSFLLSSFKMGEIESRATDSVQKRISELIAKSVPKKIRTEVLVQFGVPFSEIIKAAQKRQIDMIVMGAHGRSGMSGMLIGSVAEKVVRHAPCPVLTVKHPKYKFRKFL